MRFDKAVQEYFGEDFNINIDLKTQFKVCIKVAIQNPKDSKFQHIIIKK